MNRYRLILSIVIGGLSSGLVSIAQTTWDGGGDAEYWDGEFGADNWSTNTIPNSSSNVIFDSNAGDTGVFESITISSLTFTSNVTNPYRIITGGGDLTVNNSITNNSSAVQTFDIAVSAGTGTIAWDGPLNFKNIVNAGTKQISLSGGVTFTNATININISSLSSFGQFNVLGGAVVFSGTNIINLSGGTFSAYAAGNSFDFTTGDFSGVSLANVILPTLSGGLVWNTSNFLTQGILTVSAVPEPATYAVLLGLAVLGFGAVRRRRKA